MKHHLDSIKHIVITSQIRRARESVFFKDRRWTARQTKKAVPRAIKKERYETARDKVKFFPPLVINNFSIDPPHKQRKSQARSPLACLRPLVGQQQSSVVQQARALVGHLLALHALPSLEPRYSTRFFSQHPGIILLLRAAHFLLHFTSIFVAPLSLSLSRFFVPPSLIDDAWVLRLVGVARAAFLVRRLDYMARRRARMRASWASARRGYVCVRGGGFFFIRWV